MKTKECPSCAMDVSEDVSTCPICSYEFAGGPSRTRWIAIALFLLFVLYLIYGWI